MSVHVDRGSGKCDQIGKNNARSTDSGPGTIKEQQMGDGKGKSVPLTEEMGGNTLQKSKPMRDSNSPCSISAVVGSGVFRSKSVSKVITK